jgi:hypothetical protein
MDVKKFPIVQSVREMSPQVLISLLIVGFFFDLSQSNQKGQVFSKSWSKSHSDSMLPINGFYTNQPLMSLRLYSLDLHLSEFVDGTRP